jgi:hypothetical protein
MIKPLLLVCRRDFPPTTVMESKRALILAKAHEGIAGGHYAGKETSQKVLRDGLWWPQFT